MHFPSKKVRCYFTDSNHIVEDSKQVRTRRRRRNRNQRRQIIQDGWADYEGEVVMSEDRQLEQNCPEEKCTEAGVEKEDSYTLRGGAAGTTDYAIQRIRGRLRKRRVLFGGLKNNERLAKG